MPSALGDCYKQIIGMDYDKNQLYNYIPESDQPLPVLVFLHGSLGPFQAYNWVLKKVADDLKIAIISPGNGAGLWKKESTNQVLEHTLGFIQSNSKLDSNKLVLAAISNGGRAIGRINEILANNFKGLLLVSPVMELSQYESDKFVYQWKEKPIYIIHGKEDARIPWALIRKRYEFMASRNMNANLELYPGEDHFLFLDRRELMQEKISEWLRAYFTQM